MTEVDEKIAALEEMVRKDYDALPPFCQWQIDKMCPEPDEPFTSNEEKLKWLGLKKNRLSSMWMGMYAGAFVILMTALLGVAGLVKLLIAR